FAFGESGGHEEVFGAGGGDFVEDNFGASEAIRRGSHSAVFLRDFRPQALESFEVEVNRPGADRTASGKRDASSATAGKQRAEDQRRGAHSLYEFVGGLGGGQIAGLDGGTVMRSPIAEFHLGTHGGEQPTGGFDVAYLRNVFEDDGVFGEQGRGHAR